MDGEDGTFPVLLKTLSDPSDDVRPFSIFWYFCVDNVLNASFLLGHQIRSPASGPDLLKLRGHIL